jgi:ribulose-5-phosphate 4-epimerase/fuculose-1-phosphate aldolase
MNNPVANLSAKARLANSFYEERCQLAAVFRWAARLNMHEAVANHFSLTIGGNSNQFLINPCGRHFARMRASDLLIVDANDPSTARQSDTVDPTAWAIHGAIHRNAPHARCVLHVHPKYSLALATLKDPSMPPIDQNTMRFYNRVAIDQGFDGMGLGDEAERLSRSLGDKTVLILGNHGVLVAAPTVAQAFDELYYFERAAETLITAYSTGRELNIVSHEVADKTMRQWLDYPGDSMELHLREIRAILDKDEPDYID